MHVPDWLSCWRELATATSGLDADDPRLDPVLKGLGDCDRSCRDGDLDGFTKGAERVRRLMRFAPGATVRWKGTVNHRLMVLGPATVEHVHHDGRALWVFVTWQDTGHWISDSIIVSIEGTTT